MKPFIIFLFLVFSCSLPTERQKAINRINSAVTKKTEHEFGITTFGVGVLGPDTVHALSYSFISYDKKDKDGLRKLIIKVVKSIILIAQNDKKIDEELHNPPFTENHVIASIIFLSKDKESYDPDLIDRISFNQGVIRYSKQNELTKRYEVTSEETYDEALRILGN